MPERRTGNPHNAPACAATGAGDGQYAIQLSSRFPLRKDRAMKTLDDFAAIAVKAVLSMGLILLAVAAIVVVGTWLLKRKGINLNIGAMTPGAYVKRSLMTATEKRFFAVLKTAFPEFEVFPQVALSALVHTRRRRGWMTYRNKIANKYVDFVICLPDSYEVVAVIELDDRTHLSADRVKADRDKDIAIKDAGYPIFRYQAAHMPTPDSVRADFARHPGMR